MEFKGTQGEWRAVHLNATEFYLERNEVHYGEDGECVAEFIGDDYDAKLIAAAPDLLKALKNLITETLDLELSHGAGVEYELEDELKEAYSAINKALN